MTPGFARVMMGAICAAALTVLPGCISLLPESEPDTLYRLEQADLPDVTPAGDGVTVIVGRIDAPRGLASERIAIEREGRIAYMAGAAWLSPAPTLLYSTVLDAFQSEAPAIVAARVEDGVAARYVLDLELRHFQAVYDNGPGAAPDIRVSLRARMIDRRSRALIAARSLNATQRASANRQGAIVDGFSAASGRVAADLADWAETIVCTGDDAPPACS